MVPTVVLVGGLFPWLALTIGVAFAAGFGWLVAHGERAIMTPVTVVELEPVDATTAALPKAA